MNYNRTTTQALIHVHIINYIIAIIYTHPYPITKTTLFPGTFGCVEGVGCGGAILCSSNIVQSAITQFCISDYPVSHLNSPTQLCISDYPASHLRRSMCSLGGPPQSTPRNKWTQGTLRRCMCSLGGGPPPQPTPSNEWTPRGEPRSVKHYWITRHLQGNY